MSSDYSGASRRRNIIFAFSRSEDIAESMADYLTSNICEFTTDCTLNLQMHGHSWGAHTCGIAGYKLGQRGFKPYRLICECPHSIYYCMYEFHKFHMLNRFKEALPLVTIQLNFSALCNIWGVQISRFLNQCTRDLIICIGFYT